MAAAGATLAGVGSAVAAYIPFRFGSVLIIAGGATFGIAVLVVGIARLRRVSEAWSARRSSTSRALAHIYLSYRCRQGTANEVDRVCQFGAREIGEEDHVPPEVLRSRIAVSPGILKVVERTKGPATILAGYTILYPIKPRPCQQIVDGRISRGLEIRPSDLCTTFRSPAGIYIGMVCGTVKNDDRAAALAFANEQIRAVVRGSPKAPYLFAMPATARGRYWLDHLGFTRIERRESKIWMLDPRSVERIFGGL